MILSIYLFICGCLHGNWIVIHKTDFNGLDKILIEKRNTWWIPVNSLRLLSFCALQLSRPKMNLTYLWVAKPFCSLRSLDFFILPNFLFNFGCLHRHWIVISKMLNSSPWMLLDGLRLLSSWILQFLIPTLNFTCLFSSITISQLTKSRFSDSTQLSVQFGVSLRKLNRYLQSAVFNNREKIVIKKRSAWWILMEFSTSRFLCPAHLKTKNAVHLSFE